MLTRTENRVDEWILNRGKITTLPQETCYDICTETGKHNLKFSKAFKAIVGWCSLLNVT